MHARERSQQGSVVNFLILVLAFGAVVGVFMLGVAWMLRDDGSPDQSAEAPSLMGVRITTMVPPEHRRAAEALAGWFSEETGAQVQNLEVPFGDLAATLREDANAETPRLDVAVIWYPDLGALAAKGLLAELTDMLEAHGEDLQTDDFLPGMFAACSLYQGGRFGLPFDGDTHCLYYRPSLLSKHGFDAPPATWEDFLAMELAINEAESPSTYGAAIMAAPMPLDVVSSFVNRLAAYGGRLVTAEGRPALDSPQALAALTALVEHAAQALPEAADIDQEAAMAAFLDGRAAMVEHWSELDAALRDPARSLIGDDWDVAPLPVEPGDNAERATALNRGFALAVPASAPHMEAAMAFVLYASRPDVSRRLCALEQGLDPVRTSALESEGFAAARPKLAAAMRAGSGVGVAWPSGPAASEMLAALAENLSAALAGDKTPEQALKDAQQAWLDVSAQ